MLRRGSLDAPLHADANVLVLARRLGNTWALVALNNAATAKTVLLALPEGLPAAALRDVLGAAVSAAPTVVQGRLQLEVPPLFGRVLITP